MCCRMSPHILPRTEPGARSMLSPEPREAREGPAATSVGLLRARVARRVIYQYRESINGQTLLDALTVQIDSNLRQKRHGNSLRRNSYGDRTDRPRSDIYRDASFIGVGKMAPRQRSG